MAIERETINFLQEGLRFFHDPDLHYEVTPEQQARINADTGQVVMYLGMRDYIKNGKRFRKKIEIVKGPPIFMLRPIDKTNATNWDGIINIECEIQNGEFASYNQKCITDPEKLSEFYDPDHVVTNDGTVVRASHVISYGDDAQFVIRKVDGADRTVSCHNKTSLILNKNEYICSVSGNDQFLKTLSSGIENAIKITVTFDRTMDFKGDPRGLDLFVMSDVLVQRKEIEL